MAAALVKLGYLDRTQEPAPMVKIIYMLFKPVLTDRLYNPNEFDAIGTASTVGEIAFEHKLYKSPRHSIFLIRALIGLDGIMKALDVKLNYAALFRECVRHAAKARGAD
jgi:predicted unusual protein kinase regulating ubiquinone biosynthesis (AarF/ABC1/UbiB family)